MHVLKNKIHLFIFRHCSFLYTVSMLMISCLSFRCLVKPKRRDFFYFKSIKKSTLMVIIKRKPFRENGIIFVARSDIQISMRLLNDALQNYKRTSINVDDEEDDGIAQMNIQ